jgi:hypothetical protein
MSDFSGWTFDPNRREYYYFSRQENCWIYQSGQRIQSPQAKNTTDPPAARSSAYGLVESASKRITDPQASKIGMRAKSQVKRVESSSKADTGSRHLNIGVRAQAQLKTQADWFPGVYNNENLSLSAILL